MNWDEIKEQVESHGGVKTVTMDVLRDAAGAAKLGVHVRASITKKLAGVGLGHVPQDLPTYQHEQVRLYKRGTPAGDFIEVVLSPGEQNDRTLSERFGEETVDYGSIIDKIRELVSE